MFCLLPPEDGDFPIASLSPAGVGRVADRIFASSLAGMADLQKVRHIEKISIFALGSVSRNPCFCRVGNEKGTGCEARTVPQL